MCPFIHKKNKAYNYVYLSPYSLELNPIEQFWELFKGKTKRHKLHDTETLETKIAKATNDIHIRHIEYIVIHSKNHFSNCLNKISI